MRNLTVKREKSFVACLITMKVFAEDKEHGETVIDGTPCRRIGELKNGEEKTFPIGEECVKIFVIADELSKASASTAMPFPRAAKTSFFRDETDSVSPPEIHSDSTTTIPPNPGEEIGASRHGGHDNFRHCRNRNSRCRIDRAAFRQAKQKKGFFDGRIRHNAHRSLHRGERRRLPCGVLLKEYCGFRVEGRHLVP